MFTFAEFCCETITKISHFTVPKLLELFLLVLSLFECFSLIHLCKFTFSSYLKASMNLYSYPPQCYVCLHCTYISQVQLHTTKVLPLHSLLPEVLMLAVATVSISIQMICASKPFVLALKLNVANRREYHPVYKWLGETLKK